MTAAVISLAKALRERGRVAALCGDKIRAWQLYRAADKFERPARRPDAVRQARELSQRLAEEPWRPDGSAA